jgi:hypothetical protein
MLWPWPVQVFSLGHFRLVRHVSRLGRQLEDCGALPRAIEYSAGIDADNLAKEFYQGLMRSYAALWALRRGQGGISAAAPRPVRTARNIVFAGRARSCSAHSNAPESQGRDARRPRAESVTDSYTPQDKLMAPGVPHPGRGRKHESEHEAFVANSEHDIRDDDGLELTSTGLVRWARLFGDKAARAGARWRSQPCSSGCQMT